METSDKEMVWSNHLAIKLLKRCTANGIACTVHVETKAEHVIIQEIKDMGGGGSNDSFGSPERLGMFFNTVSTLWINNLAMVTFLKNHITSHLTIWLICRQRSLSSPGNQPLLRTGKCVVYSHTMEHYKEWEWTVYNYLQQYHKYNFKKSDKSYKIMYTMISILSSKVFS